MEPVPDVTTTQTDSIVRRTISTVPDEGRFVSGTLLGGRYRIIGLLGEGGMGEVYRATDLALGQSVALKFLPAEAAKNDRLLERFQGEVRVARQVSHPNVCRVYDIGEVDGSPFLSMEYVDGEDLATLLKRIGRLPADKATEIARKICAGLSAAHDKGVIHRDLKPQNIMLNKKGEVMILDFGLAAIAHQLSGAEVRNGTPAYMAPEQLKGTEVTAKSDLYALGLVLFEIYTGKRPYSAKSMQELIELQEAARPDSVTSLATDVDPAVERVIRRCLDPDPARRPANALAVAAALPGGDPLAAALAAGETPSPEMVAAAGTAEGLALRYSIPCFLFILLSLAATPWLRQQQYALHRAPSDFPPAVLAQKSRDLAARFGYSEKPADWSVRLRERASLIRYMKDRPQPAWDLWLASEGPGLLEYREARGPLVALPRGIVTETNPAPVSPGMVQVSLDNQGRLREFRGVPYAQAPTAPPLEPEEIFRAMGFDWRQFQPAEPEVSPVVATDTWRAWRGSHPVIPATPLLVQIGSWKGQVTTVEIRWPWTATDGKPADNPLLDAAEVLALLVGAFFLFALSRRNWKRGRIDRKGAFRVALSSAVLVALSRLGAMHYVTNGAIIRLLFDVAALALLFGAILWLLYLAIEPSLRARWPHSIVTWNRLLAGQWKDPQLWSHALIGMTAGLLLVLAVEIFVALRPNLGLASGGWGDNLLSTRHWVSDIATWMVGSLQTGLLLFFVMCGLRALLRRDWIAALVMAALFAVQSSASAQPSEWLQSFAIYLVILAALIFLMLRLGLIVMIVAAFCFNSMNGLVLGLDWSVWYISTGISTLALLLSISSFAFWRSLGNRNLIDYPSENPR